MSGRGYREIPENHPVMVLHYTWTMDSSSSTPPDDQNVDGVDDDDDDELSRNS